MNTIAEVAPRVVAHVERRAVPIRDAYTVTPDTGPTYGIAFIQLVAEKVVQAIAFGVIGQEPTIVTRWNPLSRDATGLEAFAASLDAYLQPAIRGDYPPRIWLGHASALEVLDLLGRRYMDNQSATESLRRMGWQCRMLAVEAAIPGQQVVAVASDLLVAHVVTGQSPVEDRHLGAMLAWVSPPPGVDPRVEADRRAEVPAAAMLERPADDRVEKLRKTAKKGRRAEAAAARAEIEALLADGARAEWNLMVEGRAAFWGLGLGHSRAVERLAEASRERLVYQLINEHRRPASLPHSLSLKLVNEQYAAALVEDVEVCGDMRVRDRARQEGRAVIGIVTAIDQPRASRKPCRLTIHTTQEVLRIRRGTVLKLVDGSVIGHVDAVRDAPAGGGTLIDMTLTKGVRRSTVPHVGSTYDWVDTQPYDPRRARQRAYATVRQATPALAYGRELPAATRRAGLPPDLLGRAEQLRRRR